MRALRWLLLLLVVMGVGAVVLSRVARAQGLATGGLKSNRFAGGTVPNATTFSSASGVTLVGPLVGPSGGLILESTPSAPTSGTAVILRALANMSGTGKLLSLFDNTSTEVAWINHNGVVYAEELALTGIANFSIYEGATMQAIYRGDISNTAARAAHRFGNKTALTTDDARIMNWYSDENTTIRLGLEKSGVFDWPTGGADDCAGISGAMTAGSITISTTCVEAGDRIMLTHNTLAGTPGILSTPTITADTSFVITSSSASDTSTVNWLITR